MTLRTSYSGSLNTKLAEARQAGNDLIAVTNLAAITTAMGTAAGRGQRTFTVNLAVSYQPADLRALGPLWSAFQSGVYAAIYGQDIMENEVVVALNTSDQLNTSIDLNFTF